MKNNIPALLLTAALFVGLTGCSAGKTASSAASSAAASEAASSSAGSEASEVKTLSPLDTFSVTDPMEDGIYSVSFSAADMEDTEGGYKLSVTLWSYDLYDMADANALKVGDTVVVHSDGTDKTEEITVTSIDSADGVITINGGVEEGGIYLKAEDTVYRTLHMDDYPMYYEIGKTILTVSPDVVLSDASADFGAEPMLINGEQAAAEAIAKGDDYWVAGNTTVRIENGEVVEITRVWVP